jgi:hypothetical protein
LLRNTYGDNVRAIYFTKKGYQLGAEKAGGWAGIELVLCEEGQSVEETFGLHFRRYDPTLKKTVQGALVRPATLHINFGESV